MDYTYGASTILSFLVTRFNLFYEKNLLEQSIILFRQKYTCMYAYDCAIQDTMSCWYIIILYYYY
jgi:hypothetical protein